MSAPRAVASVLEDLQAGPPAGAVPATPFPTGFMPLDEVLDGGLRTHGLTLIGGVPGVGKTVAALQMARHMAAAGATAIYACYEHDEIELLGRLLLMELGALARPEDAAVLDKLRVAIRDSIIGQRTLNDVGEGQELLDTAQQWMSRYADRLLLVRASGRHTGITELEALVAEHGTERTALFVDYLQKVAVRPDPRDEAEKVTHIAEGLKEVALQHHAAVVAIVAADRASLDARRLRMHHLRGSSALAYESDLVVLLNEKFSCVSKVHLAYDTRRAETYRDYAVWSIEKNRSGPSPMDLEFRKDFAQYRFDPRGGHVAERLVDGHVTEE